ncbi:MAG: hypothetical protein BalsKO_07400 [Balneolaceae bacterium]
MKAHKSNNFGYNKKLKKLASKNRRKATKSEACIWKYALSRKQTGFTFKRQRPVLNYIADFMCQELKLIIEVDGSSHDSPEAFMKDLKRQSELENFGFKVLRFSDEEVLDNMDEVRRIISDVVEELGVHKSSLWRETLEAPIWNLDHKNMKYQKHPSSGRDRLANIEQVRVRTIGF